MRFIVFDGIDGCGKTTIAKMIKEYLRKKNYKVFLTHEPNENTKTGKKIKEIITKKQMPRNFWKVLFTQARIEHIENIIKPKLEKNFVVICDRYYYSTLAYQMNEKEWEGYLRKYNFLKPDLAFILDVNTNIALHRLEKRKKKKTVFEKYGFLEKTRKKFLEIYKKKDELRENLWLIDANQPKLKVFFDVKKIIDIFIK
jgi:dTMP kinase